MVSVSSRPRSTSFSVLRPLTNSTRVRYGHRTSGPSVQFPALLGDDNGFGVTLTRTADTQPELQWSWPNGDPGTVTLIHTDLTTSGPFPTTGEWPAVLKAGVWTVQGNALDSEGNSVPIGGQIEIISCCALMLKNGNGLMLRNGNGFLLRAAA